MTDTTLIVDHAIDRSASHDEIVTLDWSAELESELLSRCDGSVDANGVHEFWADEPDSVACMKWRVHLARDQEDSCLSGCHPRSE